MGILNSRNLNDKVITRQCCRVGDTDGIIYHALQAAQDLCTIPKVVSPPFKSYTAMKDVKDKEIFRAYCNAIVEI